MATASDSPFTIDDGMAAGTLTAGFGPGVSYRDPTQPVYKVVGLPADIIDELGHCVFEYPQGWYAGNAERNTADLYAQRYGLALVLATMQNDVTAEMLGDAVPHELVEALAAPESRPYPTADNTPIIWVPDYVDEPQVGSEHPLYALIPGGGPMEGDDAVPEVDRELNFLDSLVDAGILYLKK